MDIILTVIVMVLALVFLNALFFKMAGSDDYGFDKVIEGLIAVMILYLVIIACFGDFINIKGLPFVDQLENFAGIHDIYANDKTLFFTECAELVCLLFVISLISQYIPKTGGNGLDGKIIVGILTLGCGVILNNYLVTWSKSNSTWEILLKAVQCAIAGTAVLNIPVSLVAHFMGTSSEDSFASFIANHLSKTKVSKALTASVTNAAVLTGGLMVLENQMGSLNGLLASAPALLELGGTIVLMIVGIRLMIKSISR